MGLTVIDAGVVIGLLDASDRHHRRSVEALLVAFEAYDELVLPSSAFSECTVAASKAGPEAVEHVRHLLSEIPIVLGELTPAVAVRAARLRADHGSRMRLPDALVVATAIEERASRLLTTDRRWPSADEVGFAGNLVLV